MLKSRGVVVEAEEERADFFACGFAVPAESRDYAITISFVLDLEHHSLVGLISEIGGLGDDTVETGTFEALEPVEGEIAVGGGRCDVDRRFSLFEQRFERVAAFLKGLAAEIAITFAEEVEEDARGGSFGGEHFYA